jgi:hypothetical protein
MQEFINFIAFLEVLVPLRATFTLQKRKLFHKMPLVIGLNKDSFGALKIIGTSTLEEIGR